MIYVDCFGGDYAPDEMVKGAVLAIDEFDTEITLVGDEQKIIEVFEKHSLDHRNIKILHAPEVITMHDSSALAIRRKKKSSLVVAARKVKEDRNSVMVSAGSTGAVLAAGVLVTGRIKGVKRPALGAMLPAWKKPILLMDCGANADVTSDYLVQFAQMASIYMENVFGIENPRIALANIGSEEEKGNKLYKETHKLLKELDGINFVGNMEGNEVMLSDNDVIVCDGFTGNTILKTVEGMADLMKVVLKDVFYTSAGTKLGYLMVKNALNERMSKLSAKKYGGAPLLGVNGGIIKAHGNSDAEAFKNAIGMGVKFEEREVLEKIRNIYSNQ